jgi:hypothetical protein
MKVELNNLQVAMLFNFPCFRINEKTIKNYIDYIDCAFPCRIKHVGNTIWNATNIGDFGRMHETWI